jgi:hypothetical protein
MPRALIFPLLAALTLLPACDRQMPTTPTDTPPAAQPEARLSPSQTVPSFDPGNFVAKVDNRFFPLPIGTRFTYVGEEDGEPERDLVDVTDQQKTILGVKVTVVRDRVFQSGELTEETLDWYAQDKKGNVWYLGEDSKSYENGVVVSTEGSWEAGKNGARAGIIMPAHPHVGQFTQQEFAAGVAEDQARVLRLGLSVSVPYGQFHACIKTAEFSPLEPGVREVKFYCPKVGFVSGRDVLGGTAHLVLSSIRQ